MKTFNSTTLQGRYKKYRIRLGETWMHARFGAVTIKYIYRKDNRSCTMVGFVDKFNNTLEESSQEILLQYKF